MAIYASVEKTPIKKKTEEQEEKEEKERT